MRSHSAAAIYFALLEIAIGLTNPFGNDKIDWDADSMMQTAYTNAVELLAAPEHRQVVGAHSDDGRQLPVKLFAAKGGFAA